MSTSFSSSRILFNFQFKCVYYVFVDVYLSFSLAICKAFERNRIRKIHFILKSRVYKFINLKRAKRENQVQRRRRRTIHETTIVENVIGKEWSEVGVYAVLGDIDIVNCFVWSEFCWKFVHLFSGHKVAENLYKNRRISVQIYMLTRRPYANMISERFFV